MSAALFDVIRDIKFRAGGGLGLTKTEVDAVNRALLGGVAEAQKGMKLSDRGRALITSFEGYSASTYRDPGPTGLPITGGWGTTRDENGQPFKLGFTADEAYWKRLKARDLAEFERDVNLLIASKPTTQNQFDALVSFAYNVGSDIDIDAVPEGLGDSTLMKRHLAGDYAGARAQFAAWNKAKGKVLAGLTRRRAEEAALYAS